MQSHKQTHLPIIQSKMIKEFQCSGCVLGPDGDDLETCSGFRLDNRSDESSFRCEGHTPGTRLLGVGRIALGLPKGFNRVGGLRDGENTNIRLHTTPDTVRALWDHLNIPVWVDDGHLFVRTYAPRINVGYVDVIKGADFSIFDGLKIVRPIDVRTFIDEID